MAVYHSKDLFFSYDGVTLSGAAAGVVSAVSWPIDYNEHDITPVGTSTEMMQSGLERAGEITLTCFLNDLTRTALLAKINVPTKTAILGPKGNTGGFPKFTADDCYVRSWAPGLPANNVETVQVVIRIAGPGADSVGTAVATF